MNDDARTIQLPEQTDLEATQPSTLDEKRDPYLVQFDPADKLDPKVNTSSLIPHCYR